MNKIRHWVITGGHHNSALVVARDLLTSGDKVSWYGHRHATSHDMTDSAEYLEVKSYKIPFRDLKAGKLGSGSSFVQLARIPLGLIQSFQLLGTDKPDAVISFGGYLGFATAISAYLRGIPVFLHEQTVVAGKANKLTSVLAKRVYLTWSSSLSHFKKSSNLQVIGLPLRPSIMASSRKKLFKNGKPTILILGGKQGSHIINSKIFAHLPSLLARFNLIHQTGTTSEYGDYEKSIALQNSLPADLSECYLPSGYLGEDELGKMLDTSDLVVGRSGAHITYELGIKGKKSVLIPYLLTHDNEQLKNARFLASQKLAEIVPESELTFPTLLSAINRMLRRRDSAPLPLPRDASRIMIADMRKTLGD